ncbi:hypothetical protein [Sutterella sp.]|uniref:hypothetical protein n=1 Tax=Sutterella sp. TaxID=1981025 RepID=UPI0026DF1174|nr:hypothetical protein [Sutterella sp.]MDO5532201.1 hypothetical protein [Sutterella sp.]
MSAIRDAADSFLTGLPCLRRTADAFADALCVAGCAAGLILTGLLLNAVETSLLG